MLDSLMRAAGITPAAAQGAMRLGQRVMCDVIDLKRALELEHGHAGPELIPHNPSQVPVFEYRPLTTGVTETVDAEAALGKFCTRGHVANIGDAELEIAFQGVAGDQWSAVYRLPAGAVLDTSSFAYRKVRLVAVDMDGRAQIMAQ